MDQPCHHPDIREYDTFRCCLSCGFALPLAISAVETALGCTSEPKQGKECHYRQLNYEFGQEIRLIKLKPGEYSDPITCEIVHANLLDKPKYEALSYTWADDYGDDTPSHHAICMRGRCIISITANCGAALRRLRHRVTTRTIWIDSICIDQENIKERNHQVMQMGKIYASAEQVVVYLGEETFDSKEIFEYLKQASVVRHQESIAISFPSNGKISNPGRMRYLLSRRWFHRVWVLQEVGLARKASVLCGEQCVDWALFSVDRLRQGGFPVNTYGASGEIVPGVLLLETELYKNRPSLVDLLHAGRNALCKDPRDKVYALLSLVSSDFLTDIRPDYSTNVAGLFTNVAMQSIMHDKTLSILSHVRGSHGHNNWMSELRNLPSWIPNWTLESNERPLDNQFSTSELDFMATWNFFLKRSFIINNYDSDPKEDRIESRTVDGALSDTTPLIKTYLSGSHLSQL